jgi:hypothetical protein
MTSTGLSWGGVFRIGLVQAAIGSIVVLMTSTLNRVMVIELGLAAAVPGALVALHFAVQFLFRPRMGHQSDRGGRRAYNRVPRDDGAPPVALMRRRGVGPQRVATHGRPR